MATKSQAKSNSRASRAPKPQPNVPESQTIHYPTTRKPAIIQRQTWPHFVLSGITNINSQT